MNATVPNIKKEVTVNYPLEYVQARMKYLCTESKFYKGYSERFVTMNEWRYYFEKPYHGMVDTGMEAHISIEEAVYSEKTKITIEIIDGWNGTDSYDIDSSNVLIDNIMNGFNLTFTMDVATLERDTKPKDVEKQEADTGLKINWTNVCVSVGVFILALMWLLS